LRQGLAALRECSVTLGEGVGSAGVAALGRFLAALGQGFSALRQRFSARGEGFSALGERSAALCEGVEPAAITASRQGFSALRQRCSALRKLFAPARQAIGVAGKVLMARPALRKVPSRLALVVGGHAGLGESGAALRQRLTTPRQRLARRLGRGLAPVCHAVVS
jgi:hypothetical protein